MSSEKSRGVTMSSSVCERCPNCEGSGRLHGPQGDDGTGDRACHSCRGKGIVWHPTDEAYQPYAVQVLYGWPTERYRFSKD